MKLGVVKLTKGLVLALILLLIAACGDDDGGWVGPPPPIVLVVGSPVTYTVGRGGFNPFTANVVPGALYKISITGVADDVDLLVFGSDSTYTNLAQCAINNTAIIGVSPEDCVITASSNNLYFGVDGYFIAGSAAVYTIDIELLTITNLNLSIPFPDVINQTGAGVYSVPASSGSAYTIGITGLSDDADLFVFGNDSTFTTKAVCSPNNTLYAGTTPEDCTLTSSSNTLYFIVDSIFSSAATVQYTAITTPAPTIPAPSNEGTIGSPIVLSLDTPATGQVGLNGSSFYSVSGLAAGTRYTVSIMGLSGNANLAVYDGDSTFTNKATCLIDNTFFAGTTPEDCTLLVSGSTLYFSVTANTTSGGVAFVSLVEPGP